MLFKSSAAVIYCCTRVHRTAVRSAVVCSLLLPCGKPFVNTKTLSALASMVVNTTCRDFLVPFVYYSKYNPNDAQLYYT